MVNWFDMEKLKEEVGVKLIIQEREKHYKKESKVYMVSKVKGYYRIKRGSEELMVDYIQRYEKVARECLNAGGELFVDRTRVGT